MMIIKRWVYFVPLCLLSLAFAVGGSRKAAARPNGTQKTAAPAGVMSALLQSPQLANPSKGVLYSDDPFGKKGFYLDLRNEVMTLDALKKFAREIAGLGLNTLVIEYEATYPYKNNATISSELAYSRSEITSFVSYSASLGIEVIPVQECFGHVQYILRHDRYRHLSEDNKELSQVCPLKTKGDSLLFADLFQDMAALHPSKYIHIGGDETLLLGHDAACSEAAAREGKSKLFVNYMAMMSRIVLKMGKIPVMWADMILKYPEAAALLPKETILLDWNYGWKPNHFGDVHQLQQMGFQFWGAASLRSHPDNWYVTDWMTHFNNQRDFIPYARQNGYTAMLMTSWSTSGLYSFTWDVGHDVQQMEPIRNNYPLSGFRILIAAYAQSLSQTAALDPEAFVVAYAKKRFGFTSAQAASLWQTFQLSPELLTYGKPQKSKDISVLQRKNQEVQQTLSQLKPARNQEEFAHFQLMADLRAYYLDYKALLGRYNDPSFDRDKAGQLLDQAKQLLKTASALDQRFMLLNKGFLKDPEIQMQNMIRNRPVIALYKRLENLKQHSEQ